MLNTVVCEQRAGMCEQRAGMCVNNVQVCVNNVQVCVNNVQVCVNNVQVCALKKNYFELRHIKPRLKRLKECLEEAPYSGERFESDCTTTHVVNCIARFLSI